MPIYEYVCDKCGKLNDVLQKLNDPPPERCDSCGTEGRLTKVVSRSSFVLRGGGWYSDLYSSTKKDKDSRPEGAKEKDSRPEGAKEKDAAAKKTEAAPSTGDAKPASATDSSSSGSPGKK